MLDFVEDWLFCYTWWYYSHIWCQSFEKSRLHFSTGQLWRLTSVDGRQPFSSCPQFAGHAFSSFLKQIYNVSNFLKNLFKMWRMLFKFCTHSSKAKKKKNCYSNSLDIVKIQCFSVFFVYYLQMLIAFLMRGNVG